MNFVLTTLPRTCRPILRTHWSQSTKSTLTVVNMSTTQSEQQTNTTESQGGANETTSSKVPLPLPAPPEADDSVQKLDVSGGGSSIKLDQLGPLVINQDGTVSRIANWAEMAEIEKRNTLRILCKRNQIRMENLQEKQPDKPQEGGE